MEAISKNIIPIDIEQEMKKSFISYAMAVIINRALPDVRDGLKPVHRRILYSMSELGLTPDKPFRKCARIVGDVLGKYHPHGDSSVYDALVRLAQDFSTRYMLVNGHGNFGSVDGDSAAAMRYTEAKFAPIAMELLRDIEKETVDFVPNFDETLKQPAVLPSRFPNLLVNGSGGIAVGMATNIPPHNLGEVIDAVVAQIDDPDITLDGLMRHVPGPDFPTHGLIMGQSGIREAYRTGRGKIITRARAEIETYGANRSRIVVTELPYQVNKARLVEKIAELVSAKKLEGISDLRDESDRNGMRVVIELKKDVNANVTLNYLYKHTQMQETFGAIMIALVDGEPKVLTLKELIGHYISHQFDVIIRRTTFDLERARARAHILEGLVIALNNIDEVIALIKRSPSAPEARTGLMERFGLSEKQAQAILEMRLQRLTGLEREKINEEYTRLKETIAYLCSVLENEDVVRSIIKDELLEIKKKYADKRRTAIEPAAGDIDIEDMITPEDMVVTLTHLGYIKRLGVDTYRSQRRGGRGVAALQTREEDFVETLFVTSTHSQLLFFTNRGRVHQLRCFELPLAGRHARGTAIVNMLQLAGGEKVTAVFPVSPENNGSRFIVMATRRGLVKKTRVSELSNIRKTGLIAISLREDDELIRVLATGGNDELLLGTRRGKSLRMHEGDIRPMGRNAQGVRGIRLAKGDELVDMARVVPGSQILAITRKGMGKRTGEEEYRLQNRGGMGIKIMHMTERTGDLVGVMAVDGTEELMLISMDGTLIRMKVDDISRISRDTQGVRLMRVGEDTEVVSVAVLQGEEDVEEDVEEAGEENAEE